MYFLNFMIWKINFGFQLCFQSKFQIVKKKLKFLLSFKMKKKMKYLDFFHGKKYLIYTKKLKRNSNTFTSRHYNSPKIKKIQNLNKKKKKTQQTHSLQHIFYY